MIDSVYLVFAVPLALVAFIVGRWPLYRPVWREHITRMLGLALVLLVLLLEACQATHRAQAASWLDRAIMGLCASYPAVRPAVLEAADAGEEPPPAPPASSPDAGVVSP